MAENIKSRTASADPGTMFFQVAENKGDTISIKTIRNAFVELPESGDVEETLNSNDWHWIKDKNSYYVIGEDALRVANIFPDQVELRRPMQSGVLNKDEDKKMLIMAEIIEKTLGKAPDDKSVVCICISSPSVDNSQDSTFHKDRLVSMFSRLGWKVKVIEEGLAVVLAEKPIMIEKDEVGEDNPIPYSGIGLSCGSGRCNAVLAYKGLKVIGMSCGMGGDWIDQQVADATGEPIAQITRKKEKELNFNNLNNDDDIIFALNTYYKEMFKFVFAKFAIKFNEIKSKFDYPLDIVIAGGTAMPKGIITIIKEVVNNMNLPFKIREIKLSSDPRNSVVIGCLKQAEISKRRLDAGGEVDLD